MIKHVFLTGPPGVGKTTLVQKACDVMVSSGVSVEGFYTQEVREGRRRIGFDVVTVTGQRGLLSRVREKSVASHGGREYTVGQYVVDVPSFENLALPLFRNLDSSCSSDRQVFIIDEVGKMELFSQAFIRSVRQTLDSLVVSVLGTIPVPSGKPLGFVEEIRTRKDVTVFTVTKENRDVILPEVVSALKDCLKQSA
ncbi:cancer-related nucleoside-triphosphatase isoform X1 [Salvelinus fontinalis]|uniref:cancer-related nucleoside-triphosphatase isoform X1 n=1 Tax=Salvelinus fontinalis TaxID=8038 RepID=UPI0024853FD0|nr:cancer-related nucleoside-triphosphatase isoform X1 [Salvelinus fontinalis]